MKSVWSGNISFGMVNIPIKIYSAVKSNAGVNFHLLDKEGHRLEYKRYCPKCDREVPWEEVQKGYKISEGDYITLKKEEIEALKPRSKDRIEIRKFVNNAEEGTSCSDKII